MSAGFPIVLTADRTLTADYRLLFDGMLAASQTTSAPPAMFGRLLMPHATPAGPRAAVAPLGLRRIEAALLAGGFTPDEVAVVSEDQLGQAIGSRHAGDRHFFRRTGRFGHEQLHDDGHRRRTNLSPGNVPPLARQDPSSQPRSARPRSSWAGRGPGRLPATAPRARNWASTTSSPAMPRADAAAIFRSLMRQEPVPEVVPGGWQPAVPIPPIRGASTMGVVEISRGCGLGCSFCTIARVPMVHLPPETILADVETNVAAGLTNIAVL